MKKHDFNIVLKNFLNAQHDTIKVRLDYLTEGEDVVLYPLPGGKVEKVFMDTSQEVSLPYEIAIKLKNQEVANAYLMAINTALSDFSLDLPSKNGSYSFIDLSISEPFLNQRDEHGYYIYLLDIVAKLEIESEED
ncbi:minor capsid protein [Eremococcus coleocola]|uniref:minor capsid protein n=1 Tax=Eremococcus coleocola TaxID=88132 RepID=UPI00041338D0|nr:minor capsid protein [Eremococcus coleocola]